MKNLILYGMGGVGLALLAMSVIKKKPGATSLFSTSRLLPGPKFYIVAKGDEPADVAKRFGLPLAAFIKTGNLFRGKGQPGTTRAGYVPFVAGLAVALPAGVADMGMRPKAMGIAR